MSERSKVDDKGARVVASEIATVARGVVGELYRYIKPRVVPKITDWVSENINLSMNPYKPNYFNLELVPYLREPLERATEYVEYGGRVEIVLTGIEQLGKTIFFCSLVPYFALFYDESCLITYRSKEFAERMNSEKLLPIMRNISEFHGQLSRRENITKEFYQLQNSKVYFQGSDNIMGVSYPVCMSDEVDKWVTHEGKPHPRDEVKKRMRSFENSLDLAVCSPHKTKSSSRITQEFLKGSRGYYHLKCQNKGCNHYIASFDIGALDKGEVDSETGEIVAKNIRLICAECGYRHAENQKAKMIKEGCYIHQRSDRFARRKYSFQVGALASQFAALSWENILNEQQESGSTAPLEKQINFANSFKGLPFKRKKVTSEELKQLKNHCMSKPEKDDVIAIMMSLDTQRGHFKYITRAILKGGRSYLLDYGEFKDFMAAENYYKTKLFYQTIEEKKLQNGAKKKVINGISVCSAIWDEGGHISKIVQRRAAALPGVWIYKGFSLRGGKLYEISKSNQRRINGDKKYWNANLLHYLLIDENSESFGLPYNIKDDYLAEINASRPPNGNYEINFERWDFGERRHDYFDCEKMWYLLKHFMIERLTPEQWLRARGENDLSLMRKANTNKHRRRRAKRDLTDY
ncbi:terminase gpA endonuclease subunit [Lentisphaerota bacterium WC36G]|nr:phage terminase large subunit family protein [Lentisphaerae bacterium WC36]